MGDEWPLLFTRGEGFRRDPKTEETQEDLERRILELGADGSWRTYKDYAGELGVRQTRAKQMLEALAEGERLEVAIGPAGRSSKARCYRTEPARWEQSGSVTPYEPRRGAGVTEPDVYIETSATGSVNGLPTEPGSVAVEGALPECLRCGQANDQAAEHVYCSMCAEDVAQA